VGYRILTNLTFFLSRNSLSLVTGVSVPIERAGRHHLHLRQGPGGQHPGAAALAARVSRDSQAAHEDPRHQRTENTAVDERAREREGEQEGAGVAADEAIVQEAQGGPGCGSLCITRSCGYQLPCPAPVSSQTQVPPALLCSARSGNSLAISAPVVKLRIAVRRIEKTYSLSPTYLLQGIGSIGACALV
jgi:hypothetical protein